jgi:hypothetical protein
MTTPLGIESTRSLSLSRVLQSYGDKQAIIFLTTQKNISNNVNNLNVKSSSDQTTIEDIEFFLLVLVTCPSPITHVEVGSIFIANHSTPCLY